MNHTAITIEIFCLLLFVAACTEKEQPAARKSEVISPAADIKFTEITERAGIDFRHQSGAYGEFFMPEIMGGGAAFIDYDRDNLQDILLVGGGAWEKSETQHVPSLRLYRNRGDGTFVEQTKATGLDKVSAYGFGITVGDYDRDGDDDFYVTALEENLLLRNDGGKFTEVAQATGTAGEKVWSTASIFTDVDKDGYLDLFVGNYIKWSQAIDRNVFCSLDGVNDNYCHPNLYEGEQGVFYYNNGDGTFSEQTRARGFTGVGGVAPLKTLGIVSVDFDKNGYPDLVLANDMQPDLLFQNNGDGTFREVGTQAGIAYNQKGQPRAGMGIAAGDLDNSGYESIAIGNFSRQPISLYRALPGGTFKDNAYASRVGKPSFLTLTFGITLVDADLDGDLDMFTANGHVFTDIAKKAANISYKQAPHFFVNNGKSVFTDEAAKIGGLMQQKMVARGSAYADIDLDGDLDLLVTENNGAVHLLRNDTETNNRFLRILVQSETGNPNAIDALLTVFYDGKKQMRRVKSSDSYLSQSEFPVTFGLGNATIIDSLRIEPAGKGKTRIYRDLAVDTFYKISEDSDQISIIEK